MVSMTRCTGAAIALLVAASCATAQTTDTTTPGSDAGTSKDGSITSDGGTGCDGPCDKDGDGVPDGTDKCPGTPPKEPVNKVGCGDSQLSPKLEPTFPPFGLTWPPTGDPANAVVLSWPYTGLNRGDLFHIYWVVCDDPKTPCGISLDGPIDVPGEKWVYSAPDSDLTNGKLVFTNTTGILLASSTTTPLTGRLTVTIKDPNDAAIPFADVTTLGVTALDGKYGAEIKGTGYKVTVLGEVKEGSSSTWTPYKDYFDAAPTPDKSDAGVDAGGSLYSSFGASFYSE